METVMRLCSGLALCVAGVVAGILLSMFTLMSGDTKMITTDFVCTETAFIGESPNRREDCTRFERVPPQPIHSEANND